MFLVFNCAGILVLNNVLSHVHISFIMLIFLFLAYFGGHFLLLVSDIRIIDLINQLKEISLQKRFFFFFGFRGAK